MSHRNDEDRSNIVETDRKIFFLIFNNIFVYTWSDFTYF